MICRQPGRPAQKPTTTTTTNHFTSISTNVLRVLRIPSILRIKCILGMLLNLSTLRRRVKASRQGVASRRFRTQKLENPNPYEYATAGCPEVCKFQCFKHVRIYINAIALHKDPSFQISCFGFALPLLSCFSLPFTAPREAVMQEAAL